MMIPPRATYRLQFRQGMDFDRAASLVPYLKRLGVSHLYASPIFKAATGSTHGYDVVDHQRFDDDLGGTAGFERLSGTLKDAGLGLVLDIVPNHMAATSENFWWRDVLRHGVNSAYADHFDIDWSAPRLVLPVLGQSYLAALEAGEMVLGYEPDGLILAYQNHVFPLNPASWNLVLKSAGIDLPDAPAKLLHWIDDPANAGQLAERLVMCSQDRALVHSVHEAQHWRLAYWRAGRDALTYRRFFEITDLVGVRVEDEAVFSDVHSYVLALVEAGHVDGLRIDHIDGLSDPLCYLARLHDLAPSTPIWVEKILAPGESLSRGWPVAGTTGYEFADLVGSLLTNPGGAVTLSDAYLAFTGASCDLEMMCAKAKHEILTWNLAAELEILVHLAHEAAAQDVMARDWGPDTLRRALAALACALPVYRTYLAGIGENENDTAVLTQASHQAQRTAGLEDPSAIDDLVRLIRSSVGPQALRLRTRFQQTTGALTAKAVEDTLFYRYNRLISANEVGSKPDPLGLDPASFHAAIVARAVEQPSGMCATATHDTKRGEDARMRIAAISEAPREWKDAIRAWDAMLADTDAPEPEMRWLFYQALLGAWDTSDPAALTGRMTAYVLKAAREAKQATTWTHPDQSYETRLTDFVKRALADPAFIEAFENRVRTFIAAGARKSLVQLALKLILPGVPDIYQGTEWADMALVDPDNRRPVDFAQRAAALDSPDCCPDVFSQTKMELMRHLLALRGEVPQFFTNNDLVALRASASVQGRYLGVARRHGDSLLVILAELSAPDTRPFHGPYFSLPSAWYNATYDTVWPVNAELFQTERHIGLAEGFQDTPLVVARGALAASYVP